MATVDVVKLVIAYLNANGISAVGEVPEDATRPITRVDENGGPPLSSQMPNRYTRQDLQLHTWGDTKGEASDDVRSARDLLLAAPRQDPVHDQGVFVRVQAQMPFWQPDPDWPSEGRPGPRYLLNLSVTAR